MSGEAENRRGRELQARGRLLDAMLCYERALALEPDRIAVHDNLGTSFAQAHATLGAAFWMLDRPDRAMANFERALAIDPAFPETYGHLGNAYAETGRTDEARAAFAAGARYAKTSGWLFRRWAETHRVERGDPLFAEMERAAAVIGTLPEDERIQLHFGLAKAYDDLADYDRAFVHMHEGNARRRAAVAYDEAATLELFEAVTRTFTAEFVRQLASDGVRTELPLFVIGMPRSGTTLVEQIFAAHSGVLGAGEISDFKRSLDDALLHRAREFPDPQLLTSNVARAAGSAYAARLRARAPQAERVTDKLPVNVLYAGIIAAALPDARIVFVRRDPLDTCLSCYAQHFSASQPFAYDLGELGRYHRAYDALVDHWLSVLPRGVALEMRYEALATDPDANARALIAHAGLGWEAACARPWEAQGRVQTASAVQVRRPIDVRSIGRARNYERYLEPLRAALR